MKKGLLILSVLTIALTLFISACTQNTTETPTTNTEKKYIGNSADECSRIKYMCAQGMQSFSDEKGCGCEPISGTVCTEDAKACDDGSYVGRDPNNNCEFFACPDVQPVANKFYCNGKSYDMYESGFCASALLLEGTSCIIRDEGDIIVDQEYYDEVKECTQTVKNHANTYLCRGDYYDISELGTCARIKLANGMTCVESEFGDIIVKESKKDDIQNCMMTCGNAGPTLDLIDQNGVHSCSCSIEGMSCEGLVKPGQCGNGVCDENEYVPCPDGAQCIWAGSCPQDCPVQ